MFPCNQTSERIYEKNGLLSSLTPQKTKKILRKEKQGKFLTVSFLENTSGCTHSIQERGNGGIYIALNSPKSLILL